MSCSSLYYPSAVKRPNFNGRDFLLLFVAGVARCGQKPRELKRLRPLRI